MLLMIDNYDSFTYNLVQYFGELGAEVRVARNDAIDVAAIEQLAPSRICISPGPCTPNEAGISLDVIHHFAGKIPCSGSASGIKPSARPSAARSSAQRRSCTAKPRPFFIRVKGYSAAYPTLSLPPVITP